MNALTSVIHSFDVKAATALTRARTALYIEHPMYGVLALRLSMVEDRSIDTLCVNRKNIRYNPDYVNTLSPSLIKSAIAHEVMHVVLQHIGRCGSRNHGRWNRAADYVLNQLLHDDRMEISPDWLLNPSFVGMTTDHVYTLLEDDPEDGKKPSQDDMDHVFEPEPGEDGEVETAEDAEVNWKVATIQAARIAEKAGKLPGSMKRFVDELVNHKVDWKARLRRFMYESSKRDYSWTRPQRRMLPFGYYLPSLHSEALNTLANCIDTSGSIDQYTLNLFGTEVLAARDAAVPERMINIYCDEAVNHVDIYSEFEQAKFEMHGGGGTDFRPPFIYLEREGIVPSCFIYLTDGYGPFPASPPPYPVLWVMTTDVVPPWGEFVRIAA